MDPALLRERELFKKRALATPSVENRKKKDPVKDEPAKKKAKFSGNSAPPAPKVMDPAAYKTMTGSSQYRFSVLAKIVKYMKKRHQEGDTHPLTIEEILDETNQLDVGNKQKQWLVTEALSSNPKIVCTPDGKYAFKPTYSIKDRKSLLRLLDKHDQRGLGGVFLEDVQESLPNCEKALKILGDSVVTINRPIDKKKVLFYNDKGCQLIVDDEFQKLWRSVAVDGLDDTKIEEYLDRQGITSMQEHGLRKVSAPTKKKGGQRKNKNFKRLNEHMGDILQDYSNT